MASLFEEIKGYEKLSNKDFTRLLMNICKNLNKENSHIVVSFWLTMQEKPLKIPKMYIKSYKFLLDKLKMKLFESVKPELKCFVNTLKQIVVKSVQTNDSNIVSKKFNLYEEIVNLLQQSFLRYSSKELENIIHSYFNPTLFKHGLHKSIEYNFLLMQILRNKKNCAESLYNLILCIEEKEIKKILSYIINQKIDTTLFFIVLFFCRKNIYFQFQNIIFNESFYKRIELIEALPEYKLDFEKIELNEEILRMIFRTKPIHRECILNHLNSKIKKREILINFLCDYYSYINKENFERLELKFEENIKICESNLHHIYFLYENLTKFFEVENKNNVINEFYNILSKKNDEVIITFLKYYQNDNTILFENILRIILESKKLSPDLLQFFTENYIDQSKYFYLIAYHMEKENILKYLEIYLKDEASLRNFLCILSPYDIYLNIHYFKEVKNSVTASQLINERKEIFNHEITKSIIEELVKNPLPPIFMRTVILALLNFPKLKKFIIDLMKNLVDLKVWTLPTIYDGFIKCISLLKNSSINIILMLPENIMNDIICKDEKIFNICYEYVEKHIKELRGRSASIFKNILYKEKRKRLTKKLNTK